MVTSEQIAATRIRHNASRPISGNGQCIVTGASSNIRLNASAVIHVRIPLLHNGPTGRTAVNKFDLCELFSAHRALIPRTVFSQHRGTALHRPLDVLILGSTIEPCIAIVQGKGHGIRSRLNSRRRAADRHLGGIVILPSRRLLTAICGQRPHLLRHSQIQIRRDIAATSTGASTDIPVIIHRYGRGQNQRRAYTERVVCVVAAVVAAGEDVTHAAGVAGFRGAEPPVGGRAAEVRNTLVVGGRAGSALEVRELRTVNREVVAFAGRQADFVARQQENLRGQTVRAALVGAARASVLAVRELHLLNGVLDIAVKQVQERAVQVAVDRTTLQLVHIRAVPLTFFIDVLHQQPSAVAGVIVDTGIRIPLVDHNELHPLAIHIQEDTFAYIKTPDRLRLNSRICDVPYPRHSSQFGRRIARIRTSHIPVPIRTGDIRSGRRRQIPICPDELEVLAKRHRLERLTSIERSAHVRNRGSIEGGQVQTLHRFAVSEHTAHSRHLSSIEGRQVNRLQLTAILEHRVQVGDVRRIKAGQLHSFKVTALIEHHAQRFDLSRIEIAQIQ